jgi:hypothetical protein
MNRSSCLTVSQRAGLKACGLQSQSLARAQARAETAREQLRTTVRREANLREHSDGEDRCSD